MKEIVLTRSKNNQEVKNVEKKNKHGMRAGVETRRLTKREGTVLKEIGRELEQMLGNKNN